MIYEICSLINKKRYIGWCTNFHIRKRTHLIRNNHHSLKLQRAWNKYGADNFLFKILENDVESNVILEREIFYIKHFNSFKNGYNCTIGGEGALGRFGKDHHNSKYYYLYDLNGKYITKRLTIKGVIKFTKKMLRFDNDRDHLISGDYVVTKKYFGKSFTKHHKLFKFDLNGVLIKSYVSSSYVNDTSIDDIYHSIRKNESINNFFWKSSVTINQKKQFDGFKVKIDMYTKDEKWVRTFDSITGAYDFLNLPVNGNISKCLKFKQKTAYGYVWKIK